MSALSQKLITAACDNNIDEIKSLIFNGADINYQHRNGQSALSCASTIGHSETTRFLLDNGADPTLKDKLEWTALMHALYSGHRNIMDLVMYHNLHKVFPSDIVDIFILHGNGHDRYRKCRSVIKM